MLGRLLSHCSGSCSWFTPGLTMTEPCTGDALAVGLDCKAEPLAVDSKLTGLVMDLPFGRSALYPVQRPLGPFGTMGLAVIAPCPSAGRAWLDWSLQLLTTDGQLRGAQWARR